MPGGVDRRGERQSAGARRHEQGHQGGRDHTARARLKAVGIRVGFFIQLGYLDEQLADILATRELLETALPDDVGVSVSYPLPGTKFYELVKAQLGSKTHWQESNDLAMMFHGTYTSEFYRAIRNLLHDRVSLETLNAPARAGEYRRGRRTVGATLAGPAFERAAVPQRRPPGAAETERQRRTMASRQKPAAQRSLGGSAPIPSQRSLKALQSRLAEDHRGAGERALQPDCCRSRVVRRRVGRGAGGRCDSRRVPAARRYVAVAGPGRLDAVPCRAEGTYRAALPAYRATAATHGWRARARPGIALVPLKGAALHAMGIYAAGERPMADVDLLVREEQSPRATEIFGWARISRDLPNLETPGV